MYELDKKKNDPFFTNINKWRSDFPTDVADPQ